MNLTRAARSPLADPRLGFASVLTVMFLVLAALGVPAVCDVHPDEGGHGTAQAHNAVGQYAVPDEVGAQRLVVEVAPGPGEDPYDCSADRTVRARYDRSPSPATDLAGTPDLAVRWLVPAMPHHGPRAPSDVVAVAAPSLHALGISRT